MQFIKNLFKDDSVVGLCGILKKKETVKITLPQNFFVTTVVKPNNNYILI